MKNRKKFTMNKRRDIFLGKHKKNENNKKHSENADTSTSVTYDLVV